MVGRLLVNVLISAGRVVVTSWREASKKAAEESRRAMPLDEARKILHVSDRPSPQEIQQKYEHLFKANDKVQGGSEYLQSKIAQAKEVLDLELRIKPSESHHSENTANNPV